MDKKELILTTAKDLVIGCRILPTSRINPEKVVEDTGKLFSKMAKEVAKVYGEIKD